MKILSFWQRKSVYIIYNLTFSQEIVDDVLNFSDVDNWRVKLL